MTATEVRTRRLPVIGRRRRDRDVEAQDPVAAETVTAAPDVDIAPHDPVLAFFQSATGPVDLDTLSLDSPGLTALREAGVKLVVPLVTQGELIGLLNLGPRLSEQEYSADDRRLLESLAAQAAPALRVAQLVREQEEEVRRRERYEQEMRVAQLIQQNFLPRDLPPTPGWQLDAFYRPAREVGGDFYDVLEIDDDRLAIVIGDVTDKGVPAALVMASTRSVLRATAQRLVEPGIVLERVNDQLCLDMPPNMFVTCLYGVLEMSTGRFTFANAGHNLPVVRCEDGTTKEPRATGMPLGLLPGMSYDEVTVTIDHGQSVVLYSDALPEAHDPQREMFGFERVAASVGKVEGPMIDALMRELEGFTGADWEQEDDITIVTVRRGAEVGTAEIGAKFLGDEGEQEALGELIAAFTVPSEPGNEKVVMERVATIAATKAHLEPARLDRLKTAVAETVMNAIEHGNQNRSELSVEIAVFAGVHALVVRIRDHGGGTEVPESTEPDIDAKLRGEQSPRGWGLFLIRAMVDDVRVNIDDEHHTVDLVVKTDRSDA